VARVIEGGEIAGINGFIHLIEGVRVLIKGMEFNTNTHTKQVLIYEPDLRARATTNASVSDLLLLLSLLIAFWTHGRRRIRI